MLGRAGIALMSGVIAGALTAQAQGSPESAFRDCPQCPEMGPIAPGTFQMGATKADAKYTYGEQHANELPQHEVTIGYKFAISKFEVTVAEFAAYVAETGAKTAGNASSAPPNWDRKPDCEAFMQRGYNFDSVAADMRSAARCLPGGWDFRGNNLSIRAAVSLDDTAWDRK